MVSSQQNNNNQSEVAMKADDIIYKMPVMRHIISGSTTTTAELTRDKNYIHSADSQNNERFTFNNSPLIIPPVRKVLKMNEEQISEQ